MSRWFRLLITAVLATILVPIFSVDAAESVDVTCLIDEALCENVVITAEVSENIKTQDGKLYLFSIPTYVDSLVGKTPVASVSYGGAGTYRFTVALNLNTENSVLYSKFCVATKSGGTYQPLNSGNFITNPEVLSKPVTERLQTSSKKGVHIDFFIPTDMEDIGIEHTYFGIYYQDILSLTPTAISFTYNGVTYYFNEARMNEYDSLVSNMTRAGMSVSVGLQNGYREGYEHMIHPGVMPNGVSEIFALNTSTQQGLDTAAAIHYFLADRYNGTNSAYGKVENWIFGNEVNDGLHYYYMGAQNVENFVAEYLQSFRVAYTAIKSACSNANVYVCLQHRWDIENSMDDYGGKTFLDLFAQYARSQGDIDWGLAYHAYSFPLNDPDILNDGAASVDYHGNPTFGGEVIDSVNTPIITMKNLHVLTQYFHEAAMLKANGEVRNIILSEQGYTSNSNISGQNEAKQAANITLGYYIAQMNPDIDAFILRGHTDADEGSEYFMFGLRNQISPMQPGSEKFSYGIYKYLNTQESLEYSKFAKAALNIRDWSDAIPGWNEHAFSNMGTREETTLQVVSSANPGRVIAAGMMNQWETSYNVYTLANYDGVENWPDGFAVVNTNANYLAWQGIEKHFDKLDLSDYNYLTMDFRLAPRGHSVNGDQVEVKVRLHSGKHVFDAVGTVAVGQQYTLCVDISSWAYRNAIDNLEIQIRDCSRIRSFDGFLFAYNVQGCNAVSEAKNLKNDVLEKVDITEAQIAYQKSFTYTGSALEPEVVVRLGGEVLTQRKDYDVIYHDNVAAGKAKVVLVGIGGYSGYLTGEFVIQGGYPTVYDGVDYSLVYAYGYYKEKYPEVVSEVGDDPQALLEHFVTKGMYYGLQGIGDFNVQAYAQFNDDLRIAYGNNWEKYYIFHIEHGWREGRATSGMLPDGVQPPVYPGGGGGGSEQPPVHSHTVVIEPAVAPTCLTYGKTEGTRCSSCGEVLVEQENLAPLGHDYGENENGEPDLWDTDCDVCGAQRSVDRFRPTHSMYRMYNPNTGEHFYTGSKQERQMLETAGWKYEGIGFTFPASTGKPVYRLFQPSTGEHLYTMDEGEKETLLNQGWNVEGVAFNSGNENEVPQYRLHNPNTTVGAYHFTASEEERQMLLAAGWEDQGIGFYTCWK